MNRLIILPALVAVCVGATYLGQNQTHTQPEMSRCVDYTDHVVDSSRCSDSPRPMLVHGTLHPQPMYRTYYGGFGSNDTGSRAWGGSDYALHGHVYQSSSALEPASPVLDSSPQPYVAYRSR